MHLDTGYDPELFFKLKKPCENCPFRKQGAIELAPGRLTAIVEGLMYDDESTFHCHKTAHHPVTGGSWDENNRYAASGQDSMCAGAMIYLEKVRRPTVAMRMGRFAGLYEPEVMRAQVDTVVDELAVNPRRPRMESES